MHSFLKKKVEQVIFVREKYMKENGLAKTKFNRRCDYIITENISTPPKEMRAYAPTHNK